MVFCNEGLNVTSKVVHHYKYVLHHQLFFSSHSNFHTYVIYVYQFHRLGTHYWFHSRKLAFGFELFTSTAVLDGQAQSRSHSRPPEPPFHEAQGSVSTLVSGIPVTHVNGYLPSGYWNDKNRNCANIPGWGRVDE